METNFVGEQERRRWPNQLPFGRGCYRLHHVQRRRIHVRGHHGSNRIRFAADDLLSATKEEEVQAEESYLSYCGRYDFDGDTVIHHVELSLFPNWVGGDQERLVDLRGRRLTLSTRPLLLRGIQQTAHLIWERV
jgi:hypothetical protein